MVTVKLLIQKEIEILNFCERKSSLQLCGENEAGTDEWSGRKLERTGVELNRKEAFGYAF
jgi:hypothetical protein